MANTPHRHLPPRPSSELSTSNHFSDKLRQIILDTTNGKHDEALDSINTLCESDDSFVNCKEIAEVLFKCASIANNSVRSEEYLQIAFDCVRKALRVKPSLELIHYLGSSLYEYSDDGDGLKKAIQECEKGLTILNNRSKLNDMWKNTFRELSCNLKLEELQHRSEATQVSQSDSIQKMTNPKKEQVKVDDNGAKEKLEAKKNRATLCSNSSESKLKEREQRSEKDEKIQIDDKCVKEKPKIKQNRENSNPNSSESYHLPDDLKRVVDNGTKDVCPESKTTTKKNMEQIAAPRILFEGSGVGFFSHKERDVAILDEYIRFERTSKVVRKAWEGGHLKALEEANIIAGEYPDSPFQYKWISVISYICATRSFTMEDFELHRQNAIEAMQTCISINPSSEEYSLGSAFMHLNLSNGDALWVERAIVECKRGLAIVKPMNLDKTVAWRAKLTEILVECESEEGKTKFKSLFSIPKAIKEEWMECDLKAMDDLKQNPRVKRYLQLEG